MILTRSEFTDPLLLFGVIFDDLFLFSTGISVLGRFCLHFALLTYFCFFEMQIAKKNDEIRNLKTAIHNVEKSSEDQSRKLITEAAKGEAAELKNSEGKKSKLQQELIQLKQSLQSNLTAHRESELTLRKVKKCGTFHTKNKSTSKRYCSISFSISTKQFKTASL